MENIPFLFLGIFVLGFVFLVGYFIGLNTNKKRKEFELLGEFGTLQKINREDYLHVLQTETNDEKRKRIIETIIKDKNATREELAHIAFNLSKVTEEFVGIKLIKKAEQRLHLK